MLLGESTMRFDEIERALDAISQRMLTTTLRGLERDGLVKRTVHPTNPPQVEHTLTKLGQTLCAVTVTPRSASWSGRASPGMPSNIFARVALASRLALGSRVPTGRV